MKAVSSISDLAVVARELRAVSGGSVVMSGDEAYANCRQLWNSAVTHQPAMFAVCKTAKDVKESVSTARLHDLPLSVRGGGHDWAGRALRHNGLVVDLSRMRRVHVDAEASVATIQGGATAKDVIEAAAPYDLVAATGNCGTVGIAGLTLGGGYGPLTPRYGLALDNLLSAEVVLADGQFVYCDDHENRDLFWALRGGGGNFGVVTSIRVRLHTLGELLAGMILFPWKDAETVLRGYAEIASSAPEELSVLAGALPAPDGNPMVFLAPMWIGEPTQGQKYIQSLKHLGTPIFEQIGPMKYLDWFGMFDAASVPGRHYAAQSRWLRQLTPEAITVLIDGFNRKTSPFSIIAIHHFRGAATRVPLTATAFGLRDEHFMLEIIPAWEPTTEKDGEIHHRWARTISNAIAPYALPGGYANLLGPDEHEQVAQAYGSNLIRLQQAKKRFDPDGTFSSAITLQTRKAAA